MLKNEAQLNSRNEEQETPFLLACNKGNVDVAKLLLRNGAQINDMDKYGWSALYIACKNGHEKIVELLLDNGAEVDDRKAVACQKLARILKRLLPPEDGSTTQIKGPDTA